MHTSLKPLQAVTELGVEKLCSACGEYWPADTEFFEARKLKDGLSSRCIACTRAGIWRLFRPRYLPLPERHAAGQAR